MLAIMIIVLSIIIIDFFFFPTLLNVLLLPLLQIERVVDGMAFLNWSIVTHNISTLQITTSFHIVLLIVILYVIFSYIGKTKKTLNSDAYGSAKFMTDAEFANLIPHYTIYHDEYDRLEENDPKELNVQSTSNLNIFNDLEFSKNDFDKESDSNEEE